jgi:two-component system NarL family response regulator
MSDVSGTPRPIRILIADDHDVFRRGMRQILEEEDDIVVVGEAADGEAAVRLATALGTDGVDLVLMDLAMPGLNGIGATRRIFAEVPGLRVIILTASVEDQDLYLAAATGVAGFLTKSLSAQAVLRAIRDFVESGALPMSRTMAARAFSYLQQRSAADEAASPAPAEPARPAEGGPEASPIAHLVTRRELEVLAQMAGGLQNREIAERLSLSENTVHVHVRSILRKLGVRNRVEAVARYRGE